METGSTIFIAPTARIFSGVEFRGNGEIQDYALVGHPPASKMETQKTVIGPDFLIRSHTVIYWGNVIGHHFQTGHGALIREFNQIGDRVSIGSHTVIEHHVILGNDVRIHSGSFIPEFCVLEDEVWIGPRVAFTNVLHPMCPEARQCIKGPHIGRAAKVGAGAVVLPHVRVGERSLVGAGSVVTEDVPPGVVVGGNPARILKPIDTIKCPWEYISKPYSDLQP